MKTNSPKWHWSLLVVVVGLLLTAGVVIAFQRFNVAGVDNQPADKLATPVLVDEKAAAINALNTYATKNQAALTAKYQTQLNELLTTQAATLNAQTSNADIEQCLQQAYVAVDNLYLQNLWDIEVTQYTQEYTAKIGVCTAQMAELALTMYQGERDSYDAALAELDEQAAAIRQTYQTACTNANLYCFKEGLLNSSYHAYLLAQAATQRDQDLATITARQEALAQAWAQKEQYQTIAAQCDQLLAEKNQILAALEKTYTAAMTNLTAGS